MLGATKFNMGITQQGIKGEQTLFKWLWKKGYTYFQPDAIALSNETFSMWEVKMKEEPFKPPPFYGHGLDIRQVKARIHFQKKTGIRCGFIVFQSNKNIILWQWLDELEKGEYFDTKNGVRIYPIENFILEADQSDSP